MRHGAFFLLPLVAVLVILAMAMGGCIRWEKDPLAAYTADPKAFQLWVIPW